MLASRTAEAKEAFRADCSSANKLIHFINSRNRSRVQLSRSCSTPGGSGTPVSCDRTRSSRVSSLVTTPVSSSVSYSALSAVVRRRYLTPERVDEEKRTLSLDSLDRLQSSVEPELLRRRRGVLTGPVFSTPVRSSFRRRPRTIIGIEEATIPFGSPVEHKPAESDTKDSLQHIIIGSSMEHRSVDTRTPATSEDLQHTIIEVGEPGEDTVEHLVNHEHSPTSQIQGKSVVNQSAEGQDINQSPVHDEPVGELILDPVHDWWRELLVITDSECMTYLQSKPILANPAHRSRDTKVQRSKSTGCVQDLKSTVRKPAVQSTVPRTAQQSAEETRKRLARIQNILEFQSRVEDSILQLSR